MKVKVLLNLSYMIRSNYFICISNNFYFWEIRRQTFIFRRKIRNNADGTESILFLLCCTEVSGNGIISNPEACLLCFHIGLDENPLQWLPPIHTGEELEHSDGVSVKGLFFFIFNRKVILSASLEMFIGTCAFYLHLALIFESVCESNCW